ncbi:hypothetical protein AVEN_153439-1, partial [Araneus ventricosus]
MKYVQRHLFIEFEDLARESIEFGMRFSSNPLYLKDIYGRKKRELMVSIRNIPFLSFTRDIANTIGETFSKVSSSACYNPIFLVMPINFKTRHIRPYNSHFEMVKLEKALSKSHNTSPGPIEFLITCTAT